MSETLEKYNSDVSPEWRILSKGMEISGHTVLRCKQLRERIVGDTYASWIALLETTDPSSYHRYVTWVVIARPDGWLAESGNYFCSDELERAVGNYERRGGW